VVGGAPALAVMQLQAMLRTAFGLRSSLEVAFAHVNDRLADSLPDGHFVTAFVGEVDLDAHELSFISGGQAPILVWRAAAGRFEVHKAGSFPMGAMALERAPAAVRTALGNGDQLLLLSDGIYEQTDAAGRRYGRGRVEALVAAHPHEPPAALVERLLADLAAFADGAPQDDDITAVVVRRLSRDAT
jgi:serine phosphatase RsbU (regulator of sigma subunit)